MMLYTAGHYGDWLLAADVADDYDNSDGRIWYIRSPRSSFRLLSNTKVLFGLRPNLGTIWLFFLQQFEHNDE